MRPKAGNVLSLGPIVLMVRGLRRLLHIIHPILPRRIDSAIDALFVAESHARRIPSVRVIGDSHAQVVQGLFPFVVAHIGPATAFNLVSESSSTRSWAGIEAALSRTDPDRDIVLLMFGEIDCRIHVYLQHIKSGGQRTFQDIAMATVSRYGEAIERIEALGYRVVVQSVVGAARQDNIYNYDYYADLRTRGVIVQDFNSALGEWCRSHETEYLDVFDRVADANGIILPEFTTDGTHLDARAHSIYVEWFDKVSEGSASRERHGSRG